MTDTTVVPSWVTDPWYNADPAGQALAKRRYRQRVTSPGEVARNQRYLARPPEPTPGCTACGRFAFAVPTLCFWCRR